MSRNETLIKAGGVIKALKALFFLTLFASLTFCFNNCGRLGSQSAASSSLSSSSVAPQASPTPSGSSSLGAFTSIIGTYEGAGCDGVTASKVYTSFLGQPAKRHLDFVDYSSWTNMASAESWGSWCWQQGGVQGDQLEMTLGLVVKGGSLQSTVNGDGDAAYLAIAKDLVAKGFSNATIRLGHEMNGGWYPWAAAGKEATYAAAFRRAVGIFRSVSGQNFKFTWCVAQGWQQTTNYAAFYPGDDVVDYVGMDMYAQSAWDTSGQPDATVWANMNQSYSLDYLPSLAASHGKPISIDEWGVGWSSNGNGVLNSDSAAVMGWMLAWMASHNVAYSNYWDYDAGDYNSKISSGERPQEAAVFKSIVSGQTLFDVITVSLSEDAFQGDALADISIDGARMDNSVKVTATHGSGNSTVFTYHVPQAAQHTVQVQFMNDDYVAGASGGDRNLYIDSISLNGTAQAGTTQEQGSAGAASFTIKN